MDNAVDHVESELDEKTIAGMNAAAGIDGGDVAPNQLDVLPMDAGGLATRMKTLGAMVGLAIHDPENLWTTGFAVMSAETVGDLCMIGDRMIDFLSEPRDPGPGAMWTTLEPLLVKALADRAKKPNPLVAILEASLDLNGVEIAGSGQEPAVACIVIFKDGGQLEGAVKRGPAPGVYILAQQVAGKNRNNEMVPIPGKIIEIAFQGEDIARLAQVRDVDPKLTDTGPKIWTPRS